MGRGGKKYGLLNGDFPFLELPPSGIKNSSLIGVFLAEPQDLFLKWGKLLTADTVCVCVCATAFYGILMKFYCDPIGHIEFYCLIVFMVYIFINIMLGFIVLATLRAPKWCGKGRLKFI